MSSRTPLSIRQILSRLAALACVGVLVACTSTSARFSIEPVEEPSQMGSGSQDYAVGIDFNSNKYSNRLEELPTFELTVENQSADTLFLTPDNVRVFSGENPVRIYTAPELTGLIEEKALKEAEEFTGRQAEVFLQSDASRNDPSAALANITSSKSANQAAAIRESYAQQIGEIEKLIIVSRIASGEAGGGLLKLHAEDIEPGLPLRILVTLGQETQTFVFKIK